MEPEFNPQIPHKTLGMVKCARKAYLTREVEREGSLRLYGHQTSLLGAYQMVKEQSR